MSQKSPKQRNRNSRNSERKKERRNEILEQNKMDKLYETALLDPETIEGQIRIEADRLICFAKHDKNIDKEKIDEPKGYFDYFKSFFK